tara:strand:+ start:24654 stop:25619 length:966 start_codon:yes stop_codon:yes gene_type:complete
MKSIKNIPFAIFALSLMVSCTNQNKNEMKTEQLNTKSHWPNRAQLVISVSMQFETGAQPAGAESPFPSITLPKGQPDPAVESWYRYGAKEGVYRMLELWKKYDIKVTSHVVGAAAVEYPEVAKAIADGGHEIAAHGMYWEDQYNMSYKDELAFVKQGVDSVEAITGKRGIGYNANWLRRSPNTLKILQELGFLYHIDDLSRDEPFITNVNGRNFVVMPYTLRNNDIMNIEGRQWSPDQLLAQLKMEFDQLYEEGAVQRRMMSVSLHDRIGGTPAVTKTIEEFIKYTKQKKGVVFMRKDEIAKMVQNDPNTPIDNSEDYINN